MMMSTLSEAEVLGPAPLLAEDADAMRVVHHERHLVVVAILTYWGGRDVALHREDAVDTSIRPLLSPFSARRAEVGRVVVLGISDVGPDGEARPVEDAGVVCRSR